MKTSEVKTSSSASNLIKAKRQPFFSKEGQDSFFSESNKATPSFFSSSTIQSKPASLTGRSTLGQPSNRDKVKADSIVDNVVPQSENHIKSRTNSTQSSTITSPTVQSKCEGCEHEEEIKEKEQDINAINSSTKEVSAGTQNEGDIIEQQDEESEEGETRVGQGTAPMVNSIVVISNPFQIYSQAAPPQIQLRANVNLAPPNLPCILFDTNGTSGTLDVMFGQNGTILDATDKTDIENFVGTWVAGGLSDDLLVSGYASTEGPQRNNWQLSCGRAEAVNTELATIGVPSGKITTFAHGETDDFSNVALEPNRRATITATPGTAPVITPKIFPADNFAGRSATRFGLSEDMTVNYNAVPGIAAAEHFGVQWTLVSGSGNLVSLPSFLSPALPASYRVGNTPALEQLGLTVVNGPAAGVNLATANLQVIAPSFSTMAQVPGTGLCHTINTASAGFRGNVFMHPNDVSFNNIQWREGNGTGIGFGSLRGLNGRVHAIGGFMTIGNGNIATGSMVNTVDSVSTGTSTPRSSFLGFFEDWSGSFIWPIQWQFQAPGGAIVPYMTAFHICSVNRAGTALQSKAGAGPFSRVLGSPTSCIVGGLPAPHCC